MAFITMSDVKDEIDWEFPGMATTEAQNNYFFQGIIRELVIVGVLLNTQHRLYSGRNRW